MRTRITSVIVAIAFAAHAASGDLLGPLHNSVSKKTAKANLIEDEIYWERLLQETSSLSVTPMPISAPSASPPASPSSSPTASISASPSSSLTAAPSASTTAAPSASPSTSVTAAPSGSPIVTPDCMVELDLECVNNDGIQCDAIFPQAVICEQRPSVLTMRYNGGPCDQSFNIQPSNVYQCFDLLPEAGAGPPPLEGPAYIEARASKSGEIFFSGIVETGSEFNITNGEGLIAADTSILIREDGPDGLPMQLINFHTSCSRNLFLKDRYGSTQVAGWINVEQGVVDCVTTAIYNYDIRNTGTVNAELSTLMSTITPPGVTLDLTEDVAGQIVGPGMNFSLSISTEIDLTTRQTYSLEATLVGKNPIGRECSDTDFIEFEAGTPVFGLPPTSPPPAPPTASPAPTPDTAGQACVIEASADCLLGNLVPCSFLTSLPSSDTTCSLPDLLDLGWIYTGGTCDESTTTQTGFVCTDSAVVEGNITVRAAGNTSGNEYFNSVVEPGGTFVMENFGDAPLDAAIEVTISNDAGDVVQTMIINTVCTPEDDLTLGKTFGAFTLASYRNDEAIFQGFQEARWIYIARNTGNIALDITEFIARTNGVVSEPGDAVTLAPDEEFPFTVPQLLSLIEPGVMYTGSLETSGEPGPCSASDSEIVTIGPDLV